MLNLIGFSAQFIAIVSIAAIVISCISSPQSSIGVVSEDHPSGAELPVIAHDSDATLPMTTSHCAKSMTTPAIVTTISEFEPYPDINSMTVKQLKSYAKASGFTGYSALRKAELVALLSEF